MTNNVIMFPAPRTDKVLEYTDEPETPDKIEIKCIPVANGGVLWEYKVFAEIIFNGVAESEEAATQQALQAFAEMQQQLKGGS